MLKKSKSEYLAQRGAPLCVRGRTGLPRDSESRGGFSREGSDGATPSRVTATFHRFYSTQA